MTNVNDRLNEEELTALASLINDEPSSLLYGGASGGKTVTLQEPKADQE